MALPESWGLQPPSPLARTPIWVYVLLCLGVAISRTVTLRQAKQPTEGSSLQVTERIISEGEAFSIQRNRAPWYPPPLFEWKTGRMQDKEQTNYVLSRRVQLDSETGTIILPAQDQAPLLRFVVQQIHNKSK